MLALGVLGVFVFIAYRVNRRTRLLVDHTSLWVANGKPCRGLPLRTTALTCNRFVTATL
ncbi:hypothetical protein AB0D57_21035 [Streptomyces sp. NPDC048275]|uniref:hypothetical protein n=1 Tax=Streptomyces sp. NPDC048275 TaxID=3155629 RepID=UPI003400D8E1